MLPGYRVEDLLAVGQEDPAFPPVYIFTDRPTPEETLRLMELGAKDYWVEPISFEQVSTVVPARNVRLAPVANGEEGGEEAEQE